MVWQEFLASKQFKSTTFLQRKARYASKFQQAISLLKLYLNILALVYTIPIIMNTINQAVHVCQKRIIQGYIFRINRKQHYIDNNKGHNILRIVWYIDTIIVSNGLDISGYVLNIQKKWKWYIRDFLSKNDATIKTNLHKKLLKFTAFLSLLWYFVLQLLWDKSKFAVSIPVCCIPYIVLTSLFWRLG